MARVTAKFFATVREVTGVRSAEFDAEDIRELLGLLTKTYPRFAETVLKDDGDLKQFFSCMVNGKRIELLNGYETVLKDNDSVALFPPVGGG